MKDQKKRGIIKSLWAGEVELYKVFLWYGFIPYSLLRIATRFLKKITEQQLAECDFTLYYLSYFLLYPIAFIYFIFIDICILETARQKQYKGKFTSYAAALWAFINILLIFLTATQIIKNYIEDSAYL